MKHRLVFISYIKKDVAWMTRLKAQLDVLEMQDILEVWENSKIAAGEISSEEIHKKLQDATIAILLVSAEYLTSEFIKKTEIKQILKRRATEKLPMIPIIVSDCSYKSVGWLTGVSVRPRDEVPLKAKTSAKKDSELREIVEEIAKILGKALASTGEGPEETSKRAATVPKATGIEAVERERPDDKRETPKESDPLQALEEKAATDPELRKKLYD